MRESGWSTSSARRPVALAGGGGGTPARTAGRRGGGPPRRLLPTRRAGSGARWSARRGPGQRREALGAVPAGRGEVFGRSLPKKEPAKSRREAAGSRQRQRPPGRAESFRCSVTPPVPGRPRRHHPGSHGSSGDVSGPRPRSRTADDPAWPPAAHREPPEPRGASHPDRSIRDSSSGATARCCHRAACPRPHPTDGTGCP